MICLWKGKKFSLLELVRNTVVAKSVGPSRKKVDFFNFLTMA